MRNAIIVNYLLTVVTLSTITTFPLLWEAIVAIPIVAASVHLVIGTLRLLKMPLE